MPFAPAGPIAAFAPAATTSSMIRTSTIPSSSLIRAADTSLIILGKKRTQAQKEEEEALAAKYWYGDWFYKECEYIYDRSVIVVLVRPTISPI